MVEHHQHAFDLADVSRGAENALICLQLDQKSKLPRETISAIFRDADFKDKMVPIGQREVLFEIRWTYSASATFFSW